MEQEESTFFAESRIEIEQYVKDRILLFKLQIASKTARLSSLLFTGIILALLSFFVLLFISMMGGYYFSSLTGSLYCGFGVIAGFYLFLLIGFILFRKGIIEKPIADLIIKILFEKHKEDTSEPIK